MATLAAVAAGTTLIPVAATPAIITPLTTVHRIPMTRTRMTAAAEGIEANQGNRIRRGGVSLRVVHAGDWGFTETKR